MPFSFVQKDEGRHCVPGPNWPHGGESWSGLGHPLGYAASLWKPAGIETWFTLRYGMNVSSMYNGGAVGSGPAGNILNALESTLEGAYQVPMSGLVVPDAAPAAEEGAPAETAPERSKSRVPRGL